MSQLDQRRTEAALRESERRLATLVGNLPGMAYRCPATEPWPLTYASGGVLDLSGRPAADFMAGTLTWRGLIHPDDADAVGAEVAAAVADGALRIGESAGLPLHRFPLSRTGDAHDAVHQAVVGKVLIDVAG